MHNTKKKQFSKLLLRKLALDELSHKCHIPKAKEDRFIMGGRINGVSGSRDNAGLANVTPYPQRLGLVSQVYSYTSSPADALKRVVEGHNSAVTPVSENFFSSFFGWLSRFLDWVITF